MRVLASILLLALAPPDPEPARVAGAIAVQWRAEEPDEGLRLDLRERLAGLDGRPLAMVLDRALPRARVAVSRELPSELVATYAGVRAGLDRADAAYREGRFGEATQALAELLAELARVPELPGAAAMAREARLLEASLAWASGDRSAAEQALARALVLDPEARLSTRRAPPELVERYAALQVELLAARETSWVEPRVVLESATESEIEIEIESEIEIEIDGVLGSRSVPAGDHFVVVYRPGAPPLAALRALDEAWTIRPGPERIPDTEPDAREQAERICSALELELLVVAERREGRVGLQAHRCGQGFGPRWLGEREQLGAGVAAIVAGPFAAELGSLAAVWPVPAALTPPTEPPPVGEGPRKPWYRKGWIWGTSVGVAAIVGGAIATGVVLAATPDSSGVVVDADDFIGF